LVYITDVDIPEPDYSDSDDDQALDEEIQAQLISPKKLVNPCLESKEHNALRRELKLNQKLYVPYTYIVSLPEMSYTAVIIFDATQRIGVRLDL